MRARKVEGPIPIPPRVKSLIGCRFGNLQVKYYAGTNKHGKALWCRCLCACGNYCRVPGGQLLGTSTKERSHSQKSCGCLRADPGIRKAARLSMPAAKRAAICNKMREAVKNRKPAYSMPSSRAAELLGVTGERIEIMVKDGIITGVYRKNGLWVSSQEIAAIVAERERKQNRCPLRAIFNGGG